ncbi:MAG: type II secretion system inner membrane protein GspF [Nitrospinae bacterium]|nr:type II secretion system inner membrane protein GspF [Nitrospinota bacterium]
MPVFVYQATDRTGKLVEGTIEAKDESLVVNRLHGLQLFPIKVEKEGVSQKSQIFNLQFSIFSFFTGVSRKELMSFTQQLATLSNSGLPLDRSLSILTELQEGKRFKSILDNVQKNVHSGSTFADALSKHPRVFSKLYVSMVKAGEEGGVLEAILLRLAQFLESSEQLKDNIRSALVYPTLLTIIGGGAVTILLTFVIPKFAKIFSDMGQAMPISTQILLNVSFFVTNYWWLIILGFVFIGIFIRGYLNTEEGKFKWDSAKLKMPLIGSLQRKIEVSRFARTLGTLVRSGVPILQSLFITKDTITNSVVAKAMEGIHKRIKEGGGISDPLRESMVFPQLAIHMIKVGEETGKLEDMLIKVADTFDTEVQSSVKSLISLLEPMMILLMGLIVGFIVISMLMAIFSINDISM